MRSPKTTIQDIAKHLQVTPFTVSRAFNNRRTICEATKKAVASTAKELQSSHNKIAPALCLGTTKILGVIIPDRECHFLGVVVHGIETVAKEKSYSSLLFQSIERPGFEWRGVDTFPRSRVNGVLVSVSKERPDFSHLLELKKRNVPLVLFDRANDELDIPSVIINDDSVAFKATQHLLEQDCRRVAHIGGQQPVSIFKQRLKGYTDALTAAGLPVDEPLIKFERGASSRPSNG